MQRVQWGPAVGFAGLLAVLGAFDAGTGLGVRGWSVGAGTGAAISVLLGRALRRRRSAALGPADRITLLRADLACAVAALAVSDGPVAVLVGLAAGALVLDGVDGRVARRTGTASSLGARFDMEVDAFLILVLSAYVAPHVGWWVLLIGAARHLLVGAGRLLPWLHGELPPRPWCKVVAVVQGVVLVVAASGVLPAVVARVALVVALVLLAESFGREVRDLWLLAHRPAETAPSEPRIPELVGRG